MTLLVTGAAGFIGAAHPLNLYAASKQSNESMVYAYSHLYGLSTTGLRFFSVYGPWGRPDMAIFKFTSALLAAQPIPLYNEGKHRRDWTYIDDVVEAVIQVLDCPAQPNPSWNAQDPDPATSSAPWRIHNIGNGQPVSLLALLSLLEAALGVSAQIKYFPMQKGDVKNTHANTDDLLERCPPRVTIREGLHRFLAWYRAYFQL